jgi:hypothetical protein
MSGEQPADDPTFRVNYMIVGTQKGGTTALDTFLSQHPDIYTTPLKETHFFSSESMFAEGEPDYALYHSFFDTYSGQKMIGEATPKYMVHPHVPERLWRYNPALKIIMLLRHPADRAYSHYIMSVELEMETLSFSEAIRQEDARIEAAAGDLSAGSPLWMQSYVSRGRYLGQIKNLLRFFPREQLLILRSEDLSRDHAGTLARVYEFLGVPAVSVPQQKQVFAQKYDKMSQIDRDYLLHLLAPEVDALEDFLGLELCEWRR